MNSYQFGFRTVLFIVAEISCTYGGYERDVRTNPCHSAVFARCFYNICTRIRLVNIDSPFVKAYLFSYSY